MSFVARGVAVACLKDHRVAEVDRVQCLLAGVHNQQGLLLFVLKPQLILLAYDGLHQKASAGRRQV